MEAASSSRPPAARTALSADSTVRCLQAVVQWSLCQGTQISAFLCGFLSCCPSHCSAFLFQEPITLTMACSVSFSVQESAAI